MDFSALNGMSDVNFQVKWTGSPRVVIVAPRGEAVYDNGFKLRAHNFPV